jgi:hypothetical protein
MSFLFSTDGASWLALRNARLETVQDCLGLKDLQPLSRDDLEFGLPGREGRIALVHQIDGWTPVEGMQIWMPFFPPPDPSDAPALHNLKRLSLHFDEIQFFASIPVADAYCWAKVVKGDLIRSFSKVADDKYGIGQPDEAEQRLWKLTESDDEPFFMSDFIVQLSAAWSVSPHQLTEAQEAQMDKVQLWSCQMEA